MPRAAPGLRGGVWFPQDAHLDPARLVRALAERAVARGARLATGHEVLGFERAGRRIAKIVSTRGDFSADHVVLARRVVAGARRAARSARARAGGEGLQRHGAPPVGFREPAHPALGSEGRRDTDRRHPALRRDARLAGVDLSLNARRVAAILRAVERFLPGVGAGERLETWRGLRPLTPDDRPIIGRPRAFANLVLATGHGMSGISQGPMTAQLVAELCAGEPPSLPLEPFSPDRFG